MSERYEIAGHTTYHPVTLGDLDATGSSDHFTRCGRGAYVLVAFLSPSRPDEAYIHFVGVDPVRAGLPNVRKFLARGAR